MRKLRTRFGIDTEKVFIPGLSTNISSTMTKEQEKAYILQVQIEELTHRLKQNDFGMSAKPEDSSSHLRIIIILLL